MEKIKGVFHKQLYFLVLIPALASMIVRLATKINGTIDKNLFMHLRESMFHNLIEQSSTKLSTSYQIYTVDKS